MMSGAAGVVRSILGAGSALSVFVATVSNAISVEDSGLVRRSFGVIAEVPVLVVNSIGGSSGSNRLFATVSDGVSVNDLSSVSLDVRSMMY